MPYVYPPGGGGGAGTPGNVTVGPDYGNPPEPRIGVSVAMPAVGVGATNTIGVAALLSAIAWGAAQSVGVAAAMPNVAIGASKSVGVTATVAAYALGAAKTLGVGAAVPAIAVGLVNGAAGHFTGQLLGAPSISSVSSVATTTNANNITITKPSGTVDGDLLVAITGMAAASAPTLSPPAGWTSIRHQASGGATTVAACAAWYRVASGEGANYNFTSNVSSGFIATMLRIVGFDTTTLLNVQNGQGASATDPVAPTITTTVGNCLKIAACCQPNSLTTSYTPPAGYAEQSDLSATVLGVVNTTGEVATRVQAAAAASSAETMDSTQLTASNYAALHFAIAPGPVVIS